MVDYIRNERALLDRLRYEGIASLHFTFQDALSLYLGLELCPNGGWGLGGGWGGGSGPNYCDRLCSPWGWSSAIAEWWVLWVQEGGEQGAGMPLVGCCAYGAGALPQGWVGTELWLKGLGQGVLSLWHPGAGAVPSWWVCRSEIPPNPPDPTPSTHHGVGWWVSPHPLAPTTPTGSPSPAHLTSTPPLSALPHRGAI